MIRILREQAADRAVPATVLSFEPMPREYFAKSDPPARLTRFREKVCAFAAYGVERFVCAKFDERLRSMEPEDFIQSVIVGALGARHVIVGHDFKFGRNLRGDFAMLLEAGAKLGFELTEMPAYSLDGERVSSSGVRELLARGELDAAARLLGRPYAMTGKVEHGGKLGRKLGFPTANIRLHRRTPPLKGVFAARVSGGSLKNAPAVASLGTRPAVNGTEFLLEAHVFDFEGDLYREYLHVDFIARLRDEQWFPDLDALVEQMQRDAAQARSILASERRAADGEW
jgi:riboflavin kinase/FMN adenylyltransferase